MQAPPEPSSPTSRPTALSKKPPAPPSSAPRSLDVSLRTARGRTTAQQAWLRRQLNDPYVVAARAGGWRSRAAFKLMELDDRFQLLTKGARVLDLGAAPGGWSQVAAKRGAGAIVGIDLLAIEPLQGAHFILGDFNDPAMPALLAEAMGGPPTLVLSDMAPNTTGHTATDHIRIVALAELAAHFAIGVLAPGGSFVAKVLQGGSEKTLLDQLKQSFASVRHAKPPASRKDSSELYVVAKGFRATTGGVTRT